MIPINSNNTPCTPVSSNCVVWQGPTISCINICNGDTVSDVVGKLGDELCTLVDATCECNPDLTGLDLGCLPDGPLELNSVLQSIIDYVCNLPTPSGGLPDITLPTCLQYNDGAGNPVTSLPLDQFAVLLGNKICDILAQITIINDSISSIESRLTILEDCVLPCTPTPGRDVDVISSCLFPGTTVSASTLLLALETQFCEFRNAVGSIALINNAISAQCIFATTPVLNGTGNYGGVTGWVASPATLAQSNVNQWLVICDLYNAVKYIQENCCESTGCGDISFDYAYTAIDGDSDGVVDSINLDFTSSVIPAGWNDCGGSTTITVTDSNGSSVTKNVNIKNLSITPAGTNIDVSSLLTTNNLTVSIPFCVTDGTSECSDRETFIIPLNIPCPDPVTVVAGYGDITVSFNNALGATATYTISAVNTSTGTILGTTIITNPGASVSYTFSGATPGQTYNIVLSVTQGTQIRSCPASSVTIPFIEIYTAILCQTGTEVTIGWLDESTTPSVSEFWSFTDPTAGALCAKITGTVPLTTPDYETSDAIPTLLEAGCEACGTVWEVLKCDDSSVFNVDSATWAPVTPLEPGKVVKVTNNGGTVGTWGAGATECVTLVRLTDDPATITPSTLVSLTPFDDCPTCEVS